MKFLVLGCSGMVGHTVSIYLMECGHEVVGVSRKSVDFCENICFDTRNHEELKRIMDNGNFDVVVNCIGVLNDACENDKELAVMINTYLPHFLSKITMDTHTKIIHISTDCVFSGQKGEYTELSFPDGTTFYDRSKALGELKDNKNITLRSSIIGPDINPGGIGLFNWFMKQEKELNWFTKVKWTGITSIELAKVIEKLSLDDSHGLFNMVYDDSITKYGLLELFNKYFRENGIIIHPSDTPVLNKSLKRTNYSFDYAVPDYDTMVREMHEWVIKHESLYPHYNL